jgi:transposase
MIPVHSKPPAGKRRKRPGAKKGHPGSRRGKPPKIDRQVEHREECCPDCGGQLQHSQRCRQRIIEDIPDQIQVEVTEHTIHRSFCPNCKKDVEPVVPDALPNATFGHRITALTSWFHYGLGITLSQIVDILGYHLQTRLTAGGLIDAWRRMSFVLKEWYEQIAERADT